MLGRGNFDAREIGRHDKQGDRAEEMGSRVPRHIEDDKAIRVGDECVIGNAADAKLAHESETALETIEQLGADVMSVEGEIKEKVAAEVVVLGAVAVGVGAGTLVDGGAVRTVQGLELVTAAGGAIAA